MPFAPVDEGARLFYRFDGDPALPVLILSNSLGTDHSLWQAQVPAFAPHFHVLRYDSRGHGASTVSSGEYTMEMLGKDVLGLLDHLGIATAFFCGISIGGIVGQWLGLNAADRVKKLALCNTASRVGTAETWNARMETVRKGGLAAISESTLARWFTEPFLRGNPETVGRIRKMLESTPAQGYIASCAAVREVDFRNDISSVRAKVLVVAGTHDTSTPPKDTKILAEKILGARYVELDAAHLTNVELPERFSEEVLKFLAA